MNTQHVPLRQNTEEKLSVREGIKSGVGRHERMKRDRGTNDRDERSRGIEIHISDARHDQTNITLQISKTSNSNETKLI